APRRHDLESDEPKRLVSGVGEHRIAGRVDEWDQRLVHEAGEIDDIGAICGTQESAQLLGVGGRGAAADDQALVDRMADHLGAMRLSATSDQELHGAAAALDRKSTRLNSSHVAISYAVFCLKKKNITESLVDH